MGGKTYVLSLPARWIKKYQIQKGEELDVEEQDNAIVVRTEKVPAGKETEVDFSDLERMFDRGMSALYKAGCNRVKITYRNRDQLRRIEAALQKMHLGFGITRQGEGYVVIESFTDVKADEFPNALRRFFYSLEVMNQDLARALTTHDAEALRGIIARDEENNKIADMCRRIINSGVTQSLSAPHLLFYTIEQLERIGDSYKMIAVTALSSKKHVSKDIVPLLGDIQDLFVQCRVLFYDFDFKIIEEFGKKRDDVKAKLEKVYSQSQPESFPILFHLRHMAETIYDLNGVLLTRGV